MYLKKPLAIDTLYSSKRIMLFKKFKLTLTRKYALVSGGYLVGVVVHSV